MTRRIVRLVIVLTLVAGPLPTSGATFKNFDYWGGTWSDAEKSPLTGEDDLMCWAAVASNILEWTGWGGHVGGMTNTDQMFQYFQDHWTNQGGHMEYAWDWWFEGTDGTEFWSNWVDVPGGGFYPAENFYDYYESDPYSWGAMSAIDQYLRAGYGVGLLLFGPGGHAISCWGFDYNPEDPTDYTGIWVTDSDDDKSSTTAPDQLRYYLVRYDVGRWYLQDFYGSNEWYIQEVQALHRIPEPVGLYVLLVGSAAIIRKRRK